ncbi:unnamed protein product [Rotaria socialis]|uniref:Palmitoyltransferase n=1 Tax=Rotaria socialis TaxID=392032 RepID=A0A817TMN5_9BILA|nr:unnamed protein product [Rotaria socialis]CAF3357229.1 unnamed protein product [Rotaria socialis]
MKYNNIHFSSSTSLKDVRQESENLLLEPLLSSSQQTRQSTSDLFVSEEPRDFRSTCFNYISRLKHLYCTMTIPSSSKYCYDILKWIPVIFIVGILGWSYYAYVVQMCILTIDNVPKKVMYLCVYHSLLILFLWSYYRTVFEPLRGPTREFYIGEVDGEHISAAQTVNERRTALVRLSREANLPLLTRHIDGSIRYCFICRCIKPDRAHHCSVCEKCVLRYDHHCPWTNSCISYGNYKYFILFLAWSFIFCIFVAGTSFEYFILFWQSVTNMDQTQSHSMSSSGKFHLLFLFFVAIVFAISISSLFFYHLFLIGKNRTTVESYRTPVFTNGPQKDGFDLGFKQNFQEIFGNNFMKAIAPIYTTRGDGVNYPINTMILEALEQQSRSPKDIILPLDTPSSSINNDRNHLLTGNTNNQ